MATPTTTWTPDGPRLRTDTTPWHRQFWPWFLIAIPAVSVVASFATLAIAIRNADTVVSEPGYALSRFAVEYPADEGHAGNAPAASPHAAPEAGGEDPVRTVP
jgi:hypothetical protein